MLGPHRAAHSVALLNEMSARRQDRGGGAAITASSIQANPDDRYGVAGLNEAGKMAAGEDAVAAGFIVERGATGPLDVPHPRDAPAPPHHVAELDAELAQSAFPPRHHSTPPPHIKPG